MISLIFIALAAFCSSIMDAIAHHAAFDYTKSNWWHQDGWTLKYVDYYNRKSLGLPNIRNKKPIQITDAWHFFKTLMLLFWVGAVVAAFYTQPLLNSILLELSLVYPAWNGTFVLFYKYIWKKKK